MKLHKLEKAIHFATEAHAGQFDSAGMPYITHPLRVMELVHGEPAKIVAVLHDVVEDTDFDIYEIGNRFDSEITSAVLAITKNKGEPYREYLDRVKANALAMLVKLADMTDNTRIDRLSYLPVKRQVRLVQKYTRGRHYLLTGEWT